jgi:hypothetical protein
MITSTLIYFGSFVVWTIFATIGLLPWPSVPAGVSSAATSANLWLSKVDTFISLTTINNVVVFFITFELMIISFYLLRWILNFIPFVESK